MTTSKAVIQHQRENHFEQEESILWVYIITYIMLLQNVKDRNLKLYIVAMTEMISCY